MTENPLLKSDDIEIAVMNLLTRDNSPAHYHKLSTEITYCIRGRLRLLVGHEQIQLLLCEGECLVVPPNVPLQNPSNAEGTQVFVVKFLSTPNDKYYIEDGHIE